MNKQSLTRPYRLSLAIALTLITSIACSDDRSLSPLSPSSSTTPLSTPAKPPTSQTVSIYWLKPDSQTIELVPSPLTGGAKNTSVPVTQIETALQELLAGPANSNYTTTIPNQTQLRNVTLKPDGIHVNLSREFTTGGGTTSMVGRVAQVLYTATSLDPRAGLWLEIEGEPLEVLGGEGLELEQPLTRHKFETDFKL